MKWMGWSYEQYMSTPPEYVRQVLEMMREEREQWERDHPDSNN